MQNKFKKHLLAVH
jgi:hypothetical protein